MYPAQKVAESGARVDCNIFFYWKDKKYKAAIRHFFNSFSKGQDTYLNMNGICF
jgi:hypothetical protein